MHYKTKNYISIISVHVNSIVNVQLIYSLLISLISLLQSPPITVNSDQLPVSSQRSKFK